MLNARVLTAEFLGTFALVFFGAGAVVIDAARADALGLLGIAFANAMVLSVAVTAFIRISGAHFNPAVTIALWMANRVGGKTAALYIGVQLLAAFIAAFAIRSLLPQMPAETMGFGTPRIAPDVDLVGAILIEAMLTFFLVTAVFGTAVSSEAPAVGGFGIGLVLLFATLVGGPLTGAALNPARAFGPALMANEWVGHAVYWIGPITGGAVASLLWTKLLLPRNDVVASATTS